MIETNLEKGLVAARGSTLRWPTTCSRCGETAEGSVPLARLARKGHPDMLVDVPVCVAHRRTWERNRGRARLFLGLALLAILGGCAAAMAVLPSGGGWGTFLTIFGLPLALVVAGIAFQGRADKVAGVKVEEWVGEVDQALFRFERVEFAKTFHELN